MMTTYPEIASERQTLDLILSGRSIARYGDGEFKMAACGASIKSQQHDPGLSRRLAAILREPGDCLVGIPNIHEVRRHPLTSEQKYAFWTKHLKFAGLLTEERHYVSSLISRPDSAPWINTDDYWQALESLWIGQDVTVVRGSGKSLAPDDLIGAGEITDVLCRKQHAYQDYDEILERIGTPKRALICLGPTATVLAYDLCQRGVHAVDLGHVAIFLRKRRRGELLTVTDNDKAVDRMAVA
jgi:hypothetical protein